MAKSQLSQGKREWYKHGWGLAAAILFFPYFIVWYAWAKSSWSKNAKIILTALIAVIMLPILIGTVTAKPSETNQQQTNSADKEWLESKNVKALQAEEAATAASLKAAEEKAAAEAAAQKKAEEEAATAAAAIRNSEALTGNSATSSQPTAPSEPSSNLPFKAICNDGSVSYQDSPAKSDYRGMCSGHDGIKTKLGRTP